MPVYFIHSIPTWRRWRRKATDEVSYQHFSGRRPQVPSTYLFAALRTGEGEGWHCQWQCRDGVTNQAAPLISPHPLKKNGGLK